MRSDTAARQHTSPFISVVIPYKKTGPDHRGLEKCIDGLARQHYSADQFEIILINNGTLDDYRSVCEQFPQVKVIHESQRGSYAARNAGVGASRGTVLAFTDSDCVPDPSWLVNAAKHIVAGRERLAGHIALTFGNRRRLSVAERYEKAFAFRQERSVSLGEAVTANLIVTRNVFDRVGFFKEVFSGGDYEWNQRATAQKVGLDYAADVIVYHPARRSIAELLSKHRRTAEGDNFSVASYVKRTLPPFFAWARLLRREDLTIVDKCVSGSVHYGLRLYRNYSRLLSK